MHVGNPAPAPVNGYRKHGSGTFVTSADARITIRDTVVLLMDTRGHIFGDLCALLQQELQQEQYLPVSLDINHPQCDRMFRRMATSDADFFIMHGNRYAPFGLLDIKPMAGKTVIGVIAWECRPLQDRVHRVLLDYADGNRQVAHHLWQNGHRRVALLGSRDMLHLAQNSSRQSGRHGCVFMEEWEQRGGTTSPLLLNDAAASPDAAETQRMLDVFHQPDAPTAAFAMMDSQGRRLQELFAQHAPELLSRVEIVGFGDTPWSQMASPPFSSVNWNIERIVAETCNVIRRVRKDKVMAAARRQPAAEVSSQDGDAPDAAASIQPVCMMIKPTLVVRGCGAAKPGRDPVRP